MKINKSLLVGSILVASSLVFSACSKKGNMPTDNPTQSGTSQPAANEKQGETSKTGVISQSNGKYYLQGVDQEPIEIESYGLDLSTYVGKQVKVTGQYSGDTLFVGKVE